jgi:hypothetical protein
MLKTQDLAKKAKKAKDHGWIAGDTSVSDLPKTDLSLMCGLQPVEKPRFFLKRPAFLLKKKFLMSGIGELVITFLLLRLKVAAGRALPFQYAELWKAKN